MTPTDLKRLSSGSCHLSKLLSPAAQSPPIIKKEWPFTSKGQISQNDIRLILKGDRDESKKNKEKCRSQLERPFIISLSGAINLGHSQSAKNNCFSYHESDTQLGILTGQPFHLGNAWLLAGLDHVKGATVRAQVPLVLCCLCFLTPWQTVVSQCPNHLSKVF